MQRHFNASKAEEFVSIGLARHRAQDGRSNARRNANLFTLVFVRTAPRPGETIHDRLLRSRRVYAPITTTSPDAQLWFDRGLNWLFGFNHAEAIKCFGKALEHDPDCAMAHWGISYAAGPNYNLPWHLYDPAGKAAALARRL